MITIATSNTSRFLYATPLFGIGYQVVMDAIHTIIESHVLLAWVVLAAAFFLLAKSADIFVDSSVSLANKFRIPKLVIGIVLVSFATTAPELSVSLMAALKHHPEMALGNAVGSVICNKGLALALCAVLSATAVPIIPHVLRSAGSFLLLVSGLCFAAVLPDNTLDRREGVVLCLLFGGYLFFLFRQHKKGTYHDDVDMEATTDHLQMPLYRLLLLFALALAGIIIASDFVIVSATTIARSFHIPESVIALTLVALGTSTPEIATCVIAARKGEGALAVGNILGANIMNICWVAGASATVNPLVLGTRELWFMFPWMLAIVITALFLMRTGYRLTRRQGIILLVFYVGYVASFFFVFRAAFLCTQPA